jgi:hypothetical protein
MGIVRFLLSVLTVARQERVTTKIRQSSCRWFCLLCKVPGTNSFRGSWLRGGMVKRGARLKLEAS